MLDKATYTNHLNQSIVFGSGDIFLSDNEVRDYEWEYDSNYNEITNFHKGTIKKKMKIILLISSTDNATAVKNRIFEVFEKDVLAEVPGRFQINGYYCSCYFMASKKVRWYISERYLELQVTMLTDRPDWISEEVSEYKSINGSTDETVVDTKQYPYMYGYRYSNQNSTSKVINHGFVDCDFVLRIYGGISNPLVMIGENTYQVNVSLDERERLEINSRDKSIFKITEKGYRQSVFWSASKQSYIFQKIPPGTSAVSWSGVFAFDLIIIDKRSEPPW